MWFGVIATLKNQRTGTIQSNWNGENILYSIVPNQELSSDNFRQYSSIATGSSRIC